MDINNAQYHVNHGLKAPVNRNKQTQPIANGLKLRTGWRVTRVLISILFGFKPMQETSKLSPLRMNYSEAGTNPNTDKPYPEPIQPHVKPVITSHDYVE